LAEVGKLIEPLKKKKREGDDTCESEDEDENVTEIKFFPTIVEHNPDLYRESIPKLSMIKLVEGGQGFIAKIGPMVSIWDSIYGLFSLRDARYSVIVLGFISLSILHYEQVIWLLPLTPLLVILFIFSNLVGESKFERPANTYVRNVKLI